ncbi:MAG: RNA polymerase factor sigma-54 [Acidobacteriaceae bacterium]|nr:RNA polymerase factor sigma-54 [Acidobacteriaceae bacterium]
MRVSQRQILTPGLVQMVSVLALNKLELKEMINTEMVENPVLEEIEDSSVSIEELAGREGDRERSAEEVVSTNERVEKDAKDPFDEIDFGSYFQDYLDPGFRTSSNFEEYDRPSFENFLSQPSTLTDHLEWQLGSMTLTPEVRLAADLVVGNLNPDGYLTATDEELVEALLGEDSGTLANEPAKAGLAVIGEESANDELAQDSEKNSPHYAAALKTVQQACAIVNNLDPLGVGARDLRECLMIQIAAQRREAVLVLKRAQARASQEPSDESALDAAKETAALSHSLPQGQEASQGVQSAGVADDLFEVAIRIIANHLALLQKKDMRELTHSCGCSAEQVHAAVELIRTLDPRPGQRYNVSETRLIEPDVAFVKRDGEYVVVMNEEDMPALRLSRAYRKMLREKQTEKDVREYVKERYKSAIQLLRNIEQRKNTILRTCEVIVRRQVEFLENGEQSLKPMMIKEVAEEIGVHPSTVSRAVANKYVHTAQGVYELRYFFTEGVNGPEGGDLPLVLLKRRVKKLIEDEDPSKPMTDDHLAAELQKQGIRVTRRTVAKYREDMQIPSTHQRRVR